MFDKKTKYNIDLKTNYMWNRIGTKNYRIILFLILSIKGFSQTPLTDNHWQLIFEDHFREDRVDQNKWDIWGPMTRAGEEAIVLPKNIYLSGKVFNDFLNVRIQREYPPIQYLNPYGQLQDYYYSSGWVQTICPFGYGYFEASISWPYRNGIHSAFWLFVTYGCSYKEIDIVEPWDGKNGPPGQIWDETNFSTGYFDTAYLVNGKLVQGDSHGRKEFMDDHSQFHKYGLEWTPTNIYWYVDDKCIRYHPNTGVNQLMHIILSNTIDSTIEVSGEFPNAASIDYVRVYRLKGNCSTNINTCNYDFDTPDDQVRRNIIIGGSGCSNSVSVGSNVNLRASETIQINGVFDIPIGVSFYAGVNPCDACRYCAANPDCSNPNPGGGGNGTK